MVREILERLNSDTFKQESVERRKRNKGVYIATSLHTLGATPKFKMHGGGEYKSYNYFGTDYQNRFDKVLFSRHPREEETIREWRFSQYKPLTREVFGQIDDDVIGAIFQDSNYSIIIPNPKDASYILHEGSFEGLDLVSWFIQKGFGLMRDDPNGIFVRMPEFAFNHKGVTNNVKIFFIHSFDVLEKTEDYVLFNKDGYTYFINKQTIWRFTYSKEEQMYYVAPKDAQGYYAHLLGRLPVDVAGGYWNSAGFYESFYAKAIPVADEFVSSYSAEQMVDKEASHPFIQQVQEECSACQGRGHVHQACEECVGGMELVDCTECRGVGRTNITPGIRVNVPYDQMDRDMVRIISPDVQVNVYHRAKNKQLKEDLYKALNLLLINESQSGIAKAIDQEHKDLFISKVANHVFDVILYNSINDMIAYRNVGVVDGEVIARSYEFQIIKPTQYRVRTTSDLSREYETAVIAGMPSTARIQMFLDLMDKQYSGDIIMNKRVRLMAYYDILLCYKESEKTTKLANGEVTINDLSLSTRLPNILDQLLLEKGNKWFIDTRIEAFLPFINEKFAPYKVEDNEFIRLD